MFKRVYSAGIRGSEGQIVSVEADSNNGLPGVSMVGYLSAEVKEAQERARTALKGSGFLLPPKKTVINLSPASVRKAGTTYDLAIALAILLSLEGISASCLEDSIFIGELGLDGSIKPVRGVLPIVIAAKDAGFHRCCLPAGNLEEGRTVKEMEIIPLETLEECVQFLIHPELGAKLAQKELSCKEEKTNQKEMDTLDFSEVNGQFLLKRGAEIAAAGRHNLLIVGAAGTGKTMVARRIPTILPSMEREEQIEVSKIYSICGLLPDGRTLVERRPFRSPHHTISPQALAGGGNMPKPGELSLASGGVLFLDELPEFSQKTIEILRQPLEERYISISRIHGIYRFPANIMLVAAMNPCPCGFYPDRNRCRCTQGQIRHYIGKISRPILDRFDICVEAAAVAYEELRNAKGNENSAEIKKRVERAGYIQRERFAGTEIRSNSEMGVREVRRYCRLGEKEEAFLEKVYHSGKVSGRGVHRILRVSRTIADLDGKSEISCSHLSEAVGYRGIEEKYWGDGIG